MTGFITGGRIGIVGAPDGTVEVGLEGVEFGVVNILLDLEKNMRDLMWNLSENAGFGRKMYENAGSNVELVWEYRILLETSLRILDRRGRQPDIGLFTALVPCRRILLIRIVHDYMC